MLENASANTPSRDDETNNATTEYLNRAAAAADAGDAVLAMHLYLAAFEQAAALSNVPSEAALRGLKEAWALAFSSKERSLAEYIYEKMEPYLTQDEVMCCMNQLQGLALDRLEEFGVSREDLEEMTQMISREIMDMSAGSGMPLGITPKIVKVEHIVEHPLPARKRTEGAQQVGAGDAKDAIVSASVAAACEQPSSSSSGASASDGSALTDVGAAELSVGEEGLASKTESDADTQGSAASKRGVQPAQKSASQAEFTLSEEVSQALAASAQSTLEFMAGATRESDIKLGAVSGHLNYDTLAGYDSTVRIMRDLGIGLQDDEEFQSLVKLLNVRHGLERMPQVDTLLFRSPAREDANRFVAATLGELNLPALRMHMEENLHGMPVLCVTAQADNAPKLNSLRNMFEGGGVLVLEDIDLWVAPQFESDEKGNIIAASVTRGAREAVNLIRSAVENPDVYVLVSASGEGQIDGYFLDLLEPATIIDIDFPTPEERVDIWMDIAREHPSMRGVNRADLVRLSANMPRFDMYMAAREALEEAYKVGLVTRRYQAVTRDNIFDKLAAYQPLDSSEYHELEEAVIRDFRREFDDFESFILGD